MHQIQTTLLNGMKILNQSSNCNLISPVTHSWLREWITAKPLSVGSQVAFVAHFIGRKLEYTYEVIEFTRGQKLVMRTAQGPFPMETTYTWHAIDQHSTKMTLRNRGNPSGFSKLLAPFMSFMMRKANTKDLVNIKKIIENR